METGVTLASVPLGATVIEKHFTLRRADGGVDSAFSFSMEPEEIEQFVVESEIAWKAGGRVQYGPVGAEKSSLVFRRSLYVAQDIKAGNILKFDRGRCVLGLVCLLSVAVFFYENQFT